jgi:hypothetical protein
MASILQKPDKGGQIKDLKLSTRRGALQTVTAIARELAGFIWAIARKVQSA